ncbi:MAG: SH3 domain-containing protein [Rhodospirillaceae bacterium]
MPDGFHSLALALTLALAVSCGLGTPTPAAYAADDADGPEEQAPATPAPGAATPATPSAIKTSGLPVPRFVSIRSAEINARTGPSTKYPIAWVFSRRGLPVEVTAEFDTWRRIRDREGSEGWVMQGMLSSKRSVVIMGDVRTLRKEAQPAGRPVARAEPGVVAQLLHIKGDWCEVDAGGYRGWLPRTELWGVLAGERLE